MAVMVKNAMNNDEQHGEADHVRIFEGHLLVEGRMVGQQRPPVAVYAPGQWKRATVER